MAKEETTLRKEQAENTRQKLLESARTLFSENGYKGTSMRSISRRSELADGLLYHYFPDGKKQLFQTIVTDSFIKIKNEASSGYCYEYYKNMPIEEVLISGFNRFSEIVENNISIIRILVKENDVYEFIFPESITELTEHLKKVWADFLRRRAESGEIKKMDFDTAAEVIMSYILNYIMMRVTDINPPKKADNPDIKRVIKYYADMWKSVSDK